jgi:hypothetical protein
MGTVLTRVSRMDWTTALSAGGRVYGSSVEVYWVVGVTVELNGGTGGRSGVP